MSRPRPYRHFVVIYVLAYLALNLYIGFRLDFQQQHNDFWDTYYAARILDADEPETWFNPQYPIGYCLFLKIMAGDGRPVPPAIIANLLFSTITLLASGWMFSKLLLGHLALLAVVLLSMVPEFFHYTNAGGGDPGSAAFFALGVSIVVVGLSRSSGPLPRCHSFGAGVLMGMGALFRYHVLVGSAFFAVALLLVYPRHWRSWCLMLVGLGLAYSPQPILNLVTGHGILETRFGSLNVYDLVYEINWHRITHIRFPDSAFAIVLEDPKLFLQKYLRAFFSFKQAYLPGFLVLVFGKQRQERRIAALISLWMLAYFGMFSATTSGRQIIITLPLAFLAWGMLLRIIYYRIWNLRTGSGHKRAVALGTSTVVVLLLAGLNVYRDARLIQKRARDKKVFCALEDFLLTNGVHSVRQVFTSDFDLYFRSLPPHIPYFNGGVPRLSTYRYSTEYPEFPVEDIGAFLSACRQRGVEFVVLGPGSHKLSETMGALYRARLEPDGFSLQREVGELRVFRVL